MREQLACWAPPLLCKQVARCGRAWLQGSPGVIYGIKKQLKALPKKRGVEISGMPEDENGRSSPTPEVKQEALHSPGDFVALVLPCLPDPQIPPEAVDHLASLWEKSYLGQEGTVAQGAVLDDFLDGSV